MNTDAVSVAGSTMWPETTSAGENEFSQQDPAFLELLQRFDAQQESADERRTRLAKEREEALAKREMLEKMNKLHALIAQLRSQLATHPGDSTLAAQISAAQTELFWLMGF